MNPWVAQERLGMALLHAVNSGVSHQVERTAQKCFLLPHFYFCEILLLQLPPPWCPGAAGVGRCQQEQLGQAMQAVHSVPSCSGTGMGSAPWVPPACLPGSPSLGGCRSSSAPHKPRWSRVTTLCSVTPPLYRHPEDVINSLTICSLPECLKSCNPGDGGVSPSQIAEGEEDRRS